MLLRHNDIELVDYITSKYCLHDYQSVVYDLE